MKRYAILLALALSVLLVQSAAANQVLNGGFETGDLTDWSFAPAASGSDFNVGTSWPHTGSYAADFGAVGGTDDAIAQTIATVAGDHYTFSFWLYHDETDGANDFNAYWNGTQVLALTNTPAFNYTEYTSTETATGALTTITFAGREVPSWYALDDVSVVQTSTVPLPGAVVLLGSGLLPLLGWRRFRKS